jgi:hypothetical protein
METSKMKKIIFLIIIIFSLITCDMYKEAVNMAIEKQTPPTGGAPLSVDDYDAQNKIIQTHVDQLVSGQLLITNFPNLTIPKIASNVNINHGSAWFVSIGPNDIGGSPADGRVYIKVVASGSGNELLPSFVNSAVGFFWNFTKNGFYNGAGEQLLPYILWKDGSNYYKYTLDESENKYNIEAMIHDFHQVDIIDWNMYAGGGGTFTKSIPHGVGNLFKNIRNPSVMIRNDLDTVYSNLHIGTSSTNGESIGWVGGFLDSTIIVANRLDGSFFDNVDFQLTGGYVRGWLNFEVVL